MYIQFALTLLMACTASSYPNKCSRLYGEIGERYEACVESLLKYTTMQRTYLSEPLTTCNDGSAAGYYIRKEDSSKLWIIYLEGGWFCFDEESCMQRVNQSKLYSMTSSKLWSKTRYGDGLLSVHQKTNPQFYRANHVYVPYCSSDFWIGNTTQTTSNGAKIAFHGSHIIMSVVKNLLERGLKDASRLLLVGSSAGGIGVLQNVDRVAHFLKRQKIRIDVRGLIDSSWFVDNGISSNCASSNVFDCHPQLMFKHAARYWKAVVDHSCGKKMETEQHKCLFAYNAINQINSPIFVFQWLHDTAQILADNKDLELNPENLFHYKYKQYVYKLGEKMRKSLTDINTKHGVFAASCISHTALATTESLDSIKLDGTSLNNALYCWLSKKKRNHRSSEQCKQRLIDSCTQPKCHKNCPVVRNPMTGENIQVNLPQIQPKELSKRNINLLTRLLKDFQG